MVLIYWMVAQNTVRTYGVNQVYRIVEGIRLHQKSCHNRYYFIREHSQLVLSYHILISTLFQTKAAGVFFAKHIYIQAVLRLRDLKIRIRIQYQLYGKIRISDPIIGSRFESYSY